MSPRCLGITYVVMGAGFACAGLVPYYESTTIDSEGKEVQNAAHLAWIWPSFTFVIFGLCYLFSPEFGTFLLQKSKVNGRMNVATTALFFPYLFLHWFVWFARHTILLRHEDPYNTVHEQIYLGRYPMTIAQFPEDASIIADLTAEFPSRWSLLKHGQRLYFCEPCLDQMMPDARMILRVAKKVTKLLDDDKTMKAYVHCANGRGRSSCLVVLIMLMRRNVKSLEEGFDKLRENRPQVKTSAVQRQVVRTAYEYFLQPQLLQSSSRSMEGDVELGQMTPMVSPRAEEEEAQPPPPPPSDSEDEEMLTLT